jgi:hypothetical protein
MLGFYNSRNPSIEIEAKPLEMFCPSCQRTMPQIKSYLGRHGEFNNQDDSGSIPCVRCSKCKLVYDSPLYKQKMAQLKAKGFRLPR